MTDSPIRNKVALRPRSGRTAPCFFTKASPPLSAAGSGGSFCPYLIIKVQSVVRQTSAAKEITSQDKRHGVPRYR